jgi:DNA-binding PadR family transcriptional regulator
MNNNLGREVLLAFWKCHLLHHAESRAVYGLWILEELAEHGYRVSPGTIYPMLARMERNGWLWALPGQRAKARRSYRLTAQGRRVLEELRAHIEELHREVVKGKPPSSRRVMERREVR